jgi:hypothetical protein
VVVATEGVGGGGGTRVCVCGVHVNEFVWVCACVD